MAFEQKEWEDRISEHPNRRTLTDTSTSSSSIVDVTRSEGEVYQEGDAFNAENMNDLEQRIADAFGNCALELGADYKAYVVYEDQNGNEVKKKLGSLDPTALTATPSQVLSGKTFGGYGSDDPQTGTMANRAATTTAVSSLVSGNDIVANINVGAYLQTAGGGYPQITLSDILESKTVTPSSSAQTVTPSTNKALKQVIVNAVPTQAKSVTPTAATQSVTPDSGKFLSSVTVAPVPTETKTATPSTASQDITPSSGLFLSKVTVNPVPTQTKTATPTASSQTITPDSGKFLSSVTVNAISTQTKTVTPSNASQDVTPDSGKYLTKVTVNAKSFTAGTLTWGTSAAGESGDLPITVTATKPGIAFIGGRWNSTNGSPFIRIKSGGNTASELFLQESAGGGSIIYQFAAGETISFQAGFGINYTTGISYGYFYLT